MSLNQVGQLPVTDFLAMIMRLTGAVVMPRLSIEGKVQAGHGCFLRTVDFSYGPNLPVFQERRKIIK